MAQQSTVGVEEVPEADRLDDFPHPRETAVLFGQDEAEAALQAAFGGGRMHQGWLISGPEGIGKATLAYRFAARVLAEENANAARQVKALSHPGLLVIRRPYDAKSKRFPVSIPIDEVRRLRAFLGHRANDGAWRVVIVDSADELNVNAANALLKLLEEPPPRTVFLLVSAEPGRLLPTIRSRCRTLTLSPVASNALRKAVKQALAAADKNEPADGDWPLLESIARGSVRRALSLHAAGGLELNAAVQDALAALPRVDWLAVHNLGDRLQPLAAETRFELFYDLLMGALSRIVRAAATGSRASEEAALAKRLIAPDRLVAWAELWEMLGREKAQAVALNLDRKALILDAFARIAAAAKR